MAAERRLAEFVADFRVGDESLRHAACRLVLDTVAVALPGAAAPGVAPLGELAVSQGGAGESRLWHRNARLPAAEAAFVNGAAAAALDFDSVHAGSILHADAVVVPAAWAIAERMHRSGAEFLDAYIAGAEVAHRLSLATPRQAGWFGSATIGVFGAAAAAARLLGLDADGIHHAMGIALSLSGGTKQAIVERTLTKRLQSAFAARSGIHAAFAAAAGVTGPTKWLTGEYGWFRMFETGDPDIAIDGLGFRFHLPGTGIKKFPSCLCNHVVIDAALTLMAEHGLAAEDVRGINVTISPYMQRIVGGGFDPSGDAQVAGQFSVQYAAACAVYRGGMGLAEIEPARVTDNDFAGHVGSVAVAVEPSWPGHVSPGRVTLATSRGPVSRLVEQIPGSAERPLSDAELSAKALDCLSAAGLADGDLVDRLFAIDRVADMAAFFGEGSNACHKAA